jgi:dipeptidyl aminopeptidase/acylaminoacyl peptidase
MMSRFIRPLALGTIVVAQSLASTTIPVRSSAPAPLSLDDFRRAVSIGDVRVGECGKEVAFVTTESDYDRDETHGTIRVLFPSTGTITTITRPSDDARSPRWSPDGKKLAFLAKPGKASAKPGADDPALDASQVALVSVDSLAPVFVTHEKRGVQSFAWNAKGDGFAYVTQDEAPNHAAIEAHDDAFEVRDNQWTQAEAPVPSHLWTVDASGAHARRITNGTFTLRGDPVYARDGRSVLVARFPTAYTQHYREQRLVRVDLASGRLTPVVADATANDPIFSRDGARLAFTRENPHSFSIGDAFVGSPDGSGARDLSAPLDRSVLDARFAEDDRSLIAEVHDGARARLVRLAPNRPAKMLDLGSLNPGAYDVGCDGEIAFVASSPTSPSELYVAPRGERPRAFTQYNETLVAHHAIAPSQTIEWKGAGGFTDDGVVTLPLGVAPGARAPLVLLIHGGPTATSTTSFSELPQLLAAHGWYVFQPNYRGSDNLGAAFAQATVPHITSAPGQDVEDGLTAVLAKYPIDPARIGVSGWSEGGLLTSWLIGHDTRWKAAMSGAAVNDWLMYRDLTDAQDFTPNFISATSPFVDENVRKLYRDESPLTYADRVKTPTLIMTDAGDQRVPTPLSYAFYHAIRATGTPVTMVVIPANGHFPSDPVRVEDVYRRWVGWFAEKL